MVARRDSREGVRRAVGARRSSPRTCAALLNLDLPVVDWGREEGIDETRICASASRRRRTSMMAAKAANLGPDLMRFIEKILLLQVLDAVWKEHLLALDHLRQGIGLRAYGQRDPLNEYKCEAFALFNAMLDELKERVTAMLARVEVQPERPPEPLFQPAEPRRLAALLRPGRRRPLCRRGRARGRAPARRRFDQADPSTWKNTPRNAPCPCGSGKSTTLPREGLTGGGRLRRAGRRPSARAEPRGRGLRGGRRCRFPACPTRRPGLARPRLPTTCHGGRRP